jgi:hypothetical protein
MRRSFFIIFLFTVSNSFAVRPFITDDARVVGNRLFQWESWFRFDKESWQHWNMYAYGPNNRWELALGFVHGFEAPRTEMQGYSYAIPLLQVKYLIREYKPNKVPGVALAAGSFLPGGLGAFKAPGHGAFAFLTLTQCFGEQENVLIHGNLGVNHVKYSHFDYTVITWGLGTQIKTFGGLHTIGEIFSGDPYVPGSGIAFQAGFRHIISDYVQLDFTFGKGLSGQNQLPFWYGAGVRLVTDWFLKKKNARVTD